MGILDKIFGSSEASEEGAMPWHEITKTADLDVIVDRSSTKTQLIFKHSTRCGISKMVLGRFKKAYQLSPNEADLYYLDLISHRGISMDIAKQFEVVHESPQLLIIKDGVAVAHESHGAINNLVLEDYI